jgi:hypothetical protein
MRLYPFHDVQRFTTRSAGSVLRYLAFFVPWLVVSGIAWPSPWAGSVVCVGIVAYYLWACARLSAIGPPVELDDTAR